MFFASNRHQSLAAKELGDADDAQHHRGIIVDAKPGTRPGKHTKSYGKWPSRNSGFSNETIGGFSSSLCFYVYR
jgi:hypothetical protein